MLLPVMSGAPAVREKAWLARLRMKAAVSRLRWGGGSRVFKWLILIVQSLLRVRLFHQSATVGFYPIASQ